jgi:hypothetical protein
MARGLPVALVLALGWGQAAADAAVQFTVAAIEGDGWRAAGVAIALRREDSGRLSAGITAARLELPDPVGVVEDLHADCQDLVVTALRFTCRALLLQPGGAASAILRLEGRVEYRRDIGDISWDLATPADAPGQMSFGGALTADGWTLRLAAADWPAEELAPLAGLLGQAAPEISGRLNLSVAARGTAVAVQGLVFDMQGAGIAVANEAGTVATEGLDLELRGSAWRQGDRLAFDARGAIAAGEAYIEPVYVNLGEHPLRFSVRGSTGADDISLQQLVLTQDGVAHADARAELAPAGDGAWQIRDGRLRLAEAVLPGAYMVLLQPFLAGTPFADLETSGVLRGELSIAGGQPEELWLEFADVHLDDRAARLAIYGLSGEAAWAPTRDGEVTARARPMNLRWSGGFVYGISFGAADIQMDASGGRWSLPRPVSIPVLDGALEIDMLEIGDLMAGDDTVLFDARLTPVSMLELSRALGWPPLSGQLSGTLPSLSHADGTLTLGGELTAEVFDGVVAVRELRIERPLQPLTRLRAEVELSGLELTEVTEALSFGLMTGRLEGYVRGLEMIDWAPVAFDARLQTPADDRSRRRISQRAVDNIASIGGGGAGVLSTGFLRFFEDFSYDAFAIGCRLERDICQMSGLEAREQGYVILRGRGLPRIDVMGFAQRVSWSALVGQLASIMASEGPEVR